MRPTAASAPATGCDVALSPIEEHLRYGEELDGARVVRGWPLTVEGLLRNANATGRRYSRAGQPLVAISAEATVAGWTLDAILAGARLRTRLRYAAVDAEFLVEAGFELLPTLPRLTSAWSCPRTLKTSSSVCWTSLARSESTRTT